jgi:hypothetical protein
VKLWADEVGVFLGENLILVDNCIFYWMNFKKIYSNQTSINDVYSDSEEHGEHYRLFFGTDKEFSEKL